MFDIFIFFTGVLFGYYVIEDIKNIFIFRRAKGGFNEDKDSSPHLSM